MGMLVESIVPQKRDGIVLKTIFTIGLLAIAGLFVLKLVFGILGGLFGIFLALLGLAIPVFVLGAVLYVALLVFAPETARGLREKLGGS